MKRVAIVMMCVALWGCGGSSGVGGLDVRQLSPDERGALGASLSQALRNPEGAQFKWMPVLVGQKAGPTHYCGLVSAGGAGGFRKFAATILPGSKGFERGTIEHVEGGASILAGPGDDAPQSGGTAALCAGWGYSNFSLAN